MAMIRDFVRLTALNISSSRSSDSDDFFATFVIVLEAAKKGLFLPHEVLGGDKSRSP